MICDQRIVIIFVFREMEEVRPAEETYRVHSDLLYLQSHSKHDNLVTLETNESILSRCIHWRSDKTLSLASRTDLRAVFIRMPGKRQESIPYRECIIDFPFGFRLHGSL
jgi:hypothetical protein